MAFLRARQRVITGIFPHQGNNVYINPRGMLLTPTPQDPVPVLDIDHDGLPDTLVQAPGPGVAGITTDANSVNVDFDGDGTADVVIPIP